MSRGTSSRCKGNSFGNKSVWVWPLKVPWKMCGSIKCSPAMPHQTLTENLWWKLLSYEMLWGITFCPLLFFVNIEQTSAGISCFLCPQDVLPQLEIVLAFQDLHVGVELFNMVWVQPFILQFTLCLHSRNSESNENSSRAYPWILFHSFHDLSYLSFCSRTNSRLGQIVLQCWKTL